MGVTAAFKSKVLQRCRSDAEFAVYRAALEWSLADPIVIESRDDFKSESRWREKLEPFHHQVDNLITFCRRLPVTLLADDVGLGKTISAGLVASELIARARVAKILIVCPKLLGPQWERELQDKFGIAAQFVTGSALIDAEPGDMGAIITTYHSARAHLEKIPEDRFDMLVLDEAHKLRNLYGVDPTPQVAKVFQRALERRRFRYVLMLTATPIQNRLWDLYSLVDLLSSARGHENPFGTEGQFARRFIADKRETARQLKPEAREEFRRIVYGYMSRVRRADSNLDFPERKVQLHRVTPSAAELALINCISEPIQKLNRLAQISILQALVSSPHALMAQLNTMAMKGTFPSDVAAEVRTIVEPLTTTAKLEGLGQLVNRLKAENPDGWRMVVFTTRRETQTSIENYLSELGLKVGVINGSSGQRNQETIASFWAEPPEIRAIVSTEAGSEGVNLQIANVLINFDLPWNPMIVEQRIGRVQRLASKHAHVSILNIVLGGTFEEYIVGRLMEKLQMAMHAIGDIESLLEASGVGGEDDAGGFDEKIRELVVAALAGKDMNIAAEKIARSIEVAKETLEREQKNIDETLGGMDGYGYVGPRTPTLSRPERSMEFEPFVRAAFAALGGDVSETSKGVWRVLFKNGQEYVRFRNDVEDHHATAPLYAPGSPAFQRLVDRLTVSAMHKVADVDPAPRQDAITIARRWAEGFGGTDCHVIPSNVRNSFEGWATLRVRAVVAHDSCERLVDVACMPGDHESATAAEQGLAPVSELLRDPAEAGIDASLLVHAAGADPDIAEFSRFYLQRREQEVEAAGDDARRRKKLEDDFNPRIEASLVALEGNVCRSVDARVRYRLDGADFESMVTVAPRDGVVVDAPNMGNCALTGLTAPESALETCALSGQRGLRHRLKRSDVSGRYAFPDQVLRCCVSGKAILLDEAGISDVSNAVVDAQLLKTCAISGTKGEPEHFGTCGFTNVEVLRERLALSDVSSRWYRDDQQRISVVSHKTGHRSEFIKCHATDDELLAVESERCEKTGKRVKPGILERCAASGKRVMPGELEQSAVSGKRALREYFVTSSVSGTRFLESEGVRSAYGQYCAPVEGKRCRWSGALTHPDDIRTCSLLGLPVHFQYVIDDNGRLQVLDEMLNGVRRTAHGEKCWGDISAMVAGAIKAGKYKYRVESAEFSPDGAHLAVCAEIKSLLGLRVEYAAMLYSLERNTLLGRIAIGKRGRSGWR